MKEAVGAELPPERGKPGAGETHTQAAPLAHQHGPKGPWRASPGFCGLSAALGMACDEPGPPRESYQETQLQGRPKTRHQSPARALAES